MKNEMGKQRDEIQPSLMEIELLLENYGIQEKRIQELKNYLINKNRCYKRIEDELSEWSTMVDKLRAKSEDCVNHDERIQFIAEAKILRHCTKRLIDIIAGEEKNSTM